MKESSIKENKIEENYFHIMIYKYMKMKFKNGSGIEGVPSYIIIRIRLDGYVKLYGCGSQSGYYSDYVPINSSDLMNQRYKKDLFINKNI